MGKKRFDPVDACAKAVALRDRCLKAMAEAEEDPDTYGDPGDAFVTIGGNDKNAGLVLYILNSIGIPGCK